MSNADWHPARNTTLSTHFESGAFEVSHGEEHGLPRTYVQVEIHLGREVSGPIYKIDGHEVSREDFALIVGLMRGLQ